MELQARSRPNWRLKKTVSRKVDFHPIELDDVKYVWAAYKKGLLKDVSETFAEPTLGADEFTEAFKALFGTTYASCWMLFADTSSGRHAVGMVLAFWSHPNPRFAPFQIIAHMVHFPWASKRNWIESVVNFFAKIRSTIPTVAYATKPDGKRLFEVLAMHGVMRRIGTTFTVIPGQGIPVFETRK